MYVSLNQNVRQMNKMLIIIVNVYIIIIETINNNVLLNLIA